MYIDIHIADRKAAKDLCNIDTAFSVPLCEPRSTTTVMQLVESPSLRVAV